MARSNKAPAKQAWTAREVAALASGITPRAYDAKDVRGLARGDSGPAVLARFADPNADGTNRQHSYTAAEVGLLLTAVAARFERRTGQHVTVPAPFGAKVRKPRAKATPKATEAPTDATTDATTA